MKKIVAALIVLAGLTLSVRAADPLNELAFLALNNFYVTECNGTMPANVALVIAKLSEKYDREEILHVQRWLVGMFGKDALCADLHKYKPKEGE
jgi:hypothetical protein